MLHALFYDNGTYTEVQYMQLSVLRVAGVYRWINSEPRKLRFTVNMYCSFVMSWCCFWDLRTVFSPFVLRLDLFTDFWCCVWFVLHLTCCVLLCILSSLITNVPFGLYMHTSFWCCVWLFDVAYCLYCTYNVACCVVYW